MTQLALYSINLRIMGQANRPVNALQYDLLIAQRDVRTLGLTNPIFICAVFVIVIIALLYWFFGTELGSSLRATGANLSMARAQGINTNFTKVLGLMVSNGLVALSSALLAQYQGFADVNMGRGAIVIGLAAVIIGEVLFSKVFHNFALKLAAVVLGAIIYYLVYQVVIWAGLKTDDMKLITALIVAIFLAIPYWKSRFFTKGAKRGGVTQRKDRLKRRVPPFERRGLCHRHRRQRRGQVHPSERGGRGVAGGRRHHHHRRGRRHPPGGA